MKIRVITQLKSWKSTKFSIFYILEGTAEETPNNQLSFLDHLCILYLCYGNELIANNNFDDWFSKISAFYYNFIILQYFAKTPEISQYKCWKSAELYLDAVYYRKGQKEKQQTINLHVVPTIDLLNTRPVIHLYIGYRILH